MIKWPLLKLGRKCRGTQSTIFQLFCGFGFCKIKNLKENSVVVIVTNTNKTPF